MDHISCFLFISEVPIETFIYCSVYISCHEYDLHSIMILTLGFCDNNCVGLVYILADGSGTETRII